MKANFDKDLVVKNLSPKPKIYYCMSESKVEKGFGVLVYPSGSKTFIYKYKVDGTQRLLTFGEYPTTTLKDAREKYQRAAMQVRDLRRGSKDGADPVQEIKKEKERRITEAHEHKKAPSVKELIEDYITYHAKAKKRSWKEDERILNKEIVSRWGKLKAASIVRKDIILLVDEITLRSPSSAAQTLKITRKMFNWAFEKEKIPTTPCTGVKAEPDKERLRALSETEIITMWNKLDKLPLTDNIRRALKLVLVTAQRPGEVIGMHTNEITQEWSGKWIWAIPGSRTKNKRGHRVFLTKTALDLIGRLEVLDKETGEMKPKGYIFPCPHKAKDKAIEEHAMCVAVRRCFNWPMKGKKGKPLYGADGKPAMENLFDMEPWRPHDLRRTAATLMSKSIILLEHRERVLNHTIGKLDRIYNQHDYEEEKQIALETLERKILGILMAKESNVIPITAGQKAA